MKKTHSILRTICASIISGCITIASTITANAQAGTLDLTFGTGGKVTTDLGSIYDLGYSVVVQGDGKIVVAGHNYNGTDDDFALVRYNSDGSLDNTFSSDGKVITDFGGSDDDGYSVAVQQDGKIVVVGTSYSDTYGYQVALARYNSDGSLDNTFGSGGLVITNYGIGNGIIIQADGKILVAGSNFGDFALLRYNSDGSLDNTFGSGGIVTTAIGSSDDEGYSVALQGDGKMVVAGFSDNGADFDFALARYNSDGSLDNSFDSDGKVITDFGSVNDYGYSVMLQQDGRIVMAGQSSNGSIDDFALVRYNSDGSLDNTFDSDGKVLTDVTIEDVGNSVLLQQDGKIVVTGFTSNFGPYDFALVRYNSDGSLDNTFGSNGKVTTDFANDDDVGISSTMQDDGKIVMAGYIRDDTTYDFAVARYNGDGAIGIAENTAEENTISISPNPFSNELFIKDTRPPVGLAPGEREVAIFDEMGREIIRQKTSSPETRIITENLSTGFYLLRCNNGNDIVNVKLIKY